MKIYDIDYSVLSDADRKLWEEIQEQEIVYRDGKPSILRYTLRHKYPRAARHFETLFPNNYIDNVDLLNSREEYKNLLGSFEELIADKKITERNILNFIKEKRAHFIIAGILKNFTFGHHALYLFPEFKLPPNHQVDFLLIGENSEGHHFVFVELENPYGEITIQDGSFGNAIRKGIRQIDDWEIWLEKNFSSLRPIFVMYKNKERDLPSEFIDFDTSRIYYVIVGGKRENYNDKTYRLRRNTAQQRQLNILHYDNLVEFANQLLATSDK